MSSLNLRLPEEETEVIMARCPKCKHAVMVAVKHMMDKRGKKELGQLAADGCSIETVPFLEYKKLVYDENRDMCDTKCNPVHRDNG